MTHVGRILRCGTGFLGVALLSSCGQSGVFLETDKTVYELNPVGGVQVALTLRNRSGKELLYNLCLSSLQLQSNGTSGSFDGDTVCVTPAYRLHPNGDASYSKRLGPATGPGVYRFVTQTYAETANAAGVIETSDVNSADFEIRGP